MRAKSLTQGPRFNEYIMTSLRTMWGIDLEYVERMFEKGKDMIMWSIFPENSGIMV